MTLATDLASAQAQFQADFNQFKVDFSALVTKLRTAVNEDDEAAMEASIANLQTMDDDLKNLDASALTAATPAPAPAPAVPATAGGPLSPSAPAPAVDPNLPPPSKPITASGFVVGETIPVGTIVPSGLTAVSQGSPVAAGSSAPKGTTVQSIP